MSIEILFDYIAYPSPKKALLFQSGNEYVFDKNNGYSGWSKVEKVEIIIGESDTSYITELKEYRECDTNDSDYGKMKLLPLGYHKSRLLKWLHTPGEQLSLFK